MAKGGKERTGDWGTAEGGVPLLEARHYGGIVPLFGAASTLIPTMDQPIYSTAPSLALPGPPSLARCTGISSWISIPRKTQGVGDFNKAFALRQQYNLRQSHTMRPGSTGMRPPRLFLMEPQPDRAGTEPPTIVGPPRLSGQPLVYPLIRDRLHSP